MPVTKRSEHYNMPIANPTDKVNWYDLNESIEIIDATMNSNALAAASAAGAAADAVTLATDASVAAEAAQETAEDAKLSADDAGVVAGRADAKVNQLQLDVDSMSSRITTAQLTATNANNKVDSALYDIGDLNNKTARITSMFNNFTNPDADQENVCTQFMFVASASDYVESPEPIHVGNVAPTKVWFNISFRDGVINPDEYMPFESRIARFDIAGITESGNRIQGSGFGQMVVPAYIVGIQGDESPSTLAFLPPMRAIMQKNTDGAYIKFRFTLPNNSNEAIAARNYMFNSGFSISCEFSFFNPLNFYNLTVGWMMN